MKKYVCKRVLISAFTLFLIVLIMFLLMEMMPGTPFNDEKLEPQQIEVLYKKYEKGKNNCCKETFILHKKSTFMSKKSTFVHNAFTN